MWLRTRWRRQRLRRSLHRGFLHLPAYLFRVMVLQIRRCASAFPLGCQHSVVRMVEEMRRGGADEMSLHYQEGQNRTLIREATVMLISALILPLVVVIVVVGLLTSGNSVTMSQQVGWVEQSETHRIE